MKILSSTKSLAASLSANELNLANNAPAWGYVNLEQGAPMFKPMLGGILSAIPKQGDTDPAAMTNDSIDQLKSISLILTPTEQKLALGLSISAKPGTEIAKALVSDPAAKPGFELAGYLNDKEPAMTIAAKINKPLVNTIADMLLKMLPENPNAPTGIKTLIKENMNVLGREMAYSLSPSNDSTPFSFKQISFITDPAKTNGLLEMQLKNIKELSGPQGVAISEPVTYSNSKIYTMNMATPPTPPDTKMGTMTVNMAVSGDKMLSSMGSIDEIKNLIHKTKASAPRPSGDMAKALQIVDNSADMDFVASLNLLRLINVGAKTMSTVPMGQLNQMGSMFSKINVPSKSCMAVAGKIDSGRVDVSLVMPKDHLVEVMGAAMQIMMMMQQPPNGSGTMDMMQGTPDGPGRMEIKNSQ